MSRTRCVIGALVIAAWATLAAQQAPARSSASGVYSPEQASAGEKIYFNTCASCHGADLGGIERAPALAGSSFFDSWQGQDLRRLRERIDTMPPTAPNSLSDADAVAVMAFLLRAADMPSGTTTLPSDRGELARITFDRGRAPGGPTPAAAPPVRTAATRTSGPSVEWTTYGSNLASHRYSPADQITKDNFNRLQLAWRLKTDFLGPRPDTLYAATPLMVGPVLYTTAGMRRAVVALNAATGEMLWMHAEDESRRGDNAIRNGAGRGVAYWASADAADRRIIYVTPGYRLLALDAKTGIPIPTFGRNGAVDLKLDNDQEIDLDTGEIGLNATPLIVGDVVVIGAAHRPGSAPRTMKNAKGYVRGYDVRTGKRLWIFHTIPKQGEFGYDTWLEGSAEYNGNTGAWAQMFDRQGITENDLIDLTPGLKAEALEVVKRYKIGPIFTPPGRLDGSREQLPLYPLAHSRVRQRAGAWQRRIDRHGVCCWSGARRRTGTAWGWRWRTRRSARARRCNRAGTAAHQASLRSHHRVRHEHR